MHTKLKTATTQICEQFLNKTDVNIAGMMAFTTESFLICPPSGMQGQQDKQEFRKALDSLFIPSHSGTDIPAAVLQYLQFTREFLQQVPSRNELQMWKANCVIITDGLHNVQEEKWEQMKQAVLSTRSSAKSKHCYLFFFLLNLQSKDVDEAVLSRLSQVLRAERALRTKGLQPEQVYDKISSHMVTLEKCVTQFTKVKNRLAEDIEDTKTGLDRKMLEDRFKLAKVSLKKHQEEVSSFDADLKEFELESQKLFQVNTSMLAQDYRSKVESPSQDLELQAQELENKMNKMQQLKTSVHEDVKNLRKDAAWDMHDKFARDIESISRDLEQYENFLRNSEVASEDLKEDFEATAAKLREKERAIVQFFDQNQGEQFGASKLLARTQRQREKAHDLANQLSMEKVLAEFKGERKQEEETPTPRAPQGECCICADSNADFQLQCQHAFCVECLAKHVEVKADQNMPAICPQESCKHELFQDEVDRVCRLAKKGEVAETYQRRCTQRRIEGKKAKVPCPQRCGNLICSRLNDKDASCEDCNFVFCVHCNSPSHPEEPDCVAFLEKELAKGEDVSNMLESLQMLRKEGNLRVCPKCHMAYQKTSGCDHMRCGKCGHDFNYNSRDRQQQGEWQVHEQEEELKRMSSELSLQSDSTRASIGSVSPPHGPLNWGRMMKHLSN